METTMAQWGLYRDNGKWKLLQSKAYHVGAPVTTEDYNGLGSRV